MGLTGIEAVLTELNELVREGIVEDYAVGGAVAATFYLEPVATVDVDVFLVFKDQSANSLVDPQPVFRHFAERGFDMEGEYVLIGGWPVQILASTGALVDEALSQAETQVVNGIPARVLSAESLAAICLQTGRAKDKARLLQFIEEGALDAEVFLDLVERHGLSETWKQFRESFSL